MLSARGHQALVLQGTMSTTNRRKSLKTWRAARGAAKQMAKRLRSKGYDARYRGPCKSGNHYHCDIYEKGNPIPVTTIHFRWRDKRIFRWN
jgi:hypothetical protein